jgi:hypothetical protein
MGCKLAFGQAADSRKPAETESVEEQIDPVDPLNLIRKRESPLLSRTRVVQELNTAQNLQNLRYCELPSKAPADLDTH